MVVNACSADIKRVLFTADEVRDKVAELGQQICRDYKGKKLAIIGVLNGAFIFTAGESSMLDTCFY
jgi:hypoxanthine phosphoribosyltransferase